MTGKSQKRDKRPNFQKLNNFDFRASIHEGSKKVNMKVKGLGILPVAKTTTGLPSVDEASLKILAGNPKKGKYGTAYDHFVKIGQ